MKYAVADWIGGQKQLVATEPIQGGEVIIRESPLVSVGVPPTNMLSADWQITMVLLSKQKLRQELASWNLKADDPPHRWDKTGMQIEAALSKKYSLSRNIVRHIYSCIATNHIGICDGRPTVGAIRGYGIYHFLSRANHSCVPSAEMIGTADGDNMLVALRDIDPGEPIEWSYIFESDSLAMDYTSRNATLAYWFGFVCECPRCEKEEPEFLKGANKLQYFLTEIKKSGG